jgi:hypothetical protein
MLSLGSSPFTLVEGNAIVAQITAQNALGYGPASSVSDGSLQVETIPSTPSAPVANETGRAQHRTAGHLGRVACDVWESLLAVRRPVQVHLDWGHGCHLKNRRKGETWLPSTTSRPLPFYHLYHHELVIRSLCRRATTSANNGRNGKDDGNDNTNHNNTSSS